MELYGCHFEYAGVSSRACGLIFANVETSRYTAVMGETSTVSMFNRHSKKKYYVDTLYDDSPISFDAEVVSNHPISPYEMREIEKWLFNQHSYQKLYVDVDDSNYDGVEMIDGQVLRQYINCKFINPSKIEGNGGIMGWSLTVECDAPMAWQDPIFKTFDMTSLGERYITLKVDTDFAGYVYPKVTIKLKDGEAKDLQVVNITDDAYRLTTFVSMTGGATLIMDSELNMLSGDSDKYYEKFKHKNFIRLKDGENRLSVSDNVSSIRFEWQNMRWL